MTIYPRKSLGQNFLVDQKVINIITELGNISDKNEIIEVGPGTGALTRKIIEKKPKEFIYFIEGK